jgi:hypothetical protein
LASEVAATGCAGKGAGCEARESQKRLKSASILCQKVTVSPNTMYLARAKGGEFEFRDKKNEKFGRTVQIVSKLVI